MRRPPSWPSACRSSHNIIISSFGVREEGNLRPPQSNGCWQLLQYLMTLMRSRRHRQLWCSTSFKTIAKMRENGEFKARNRIHCDTISKIAVWATFSAKVWFFSFLGWPCTQLHTVVKDEFLFKNSILLIYCCQLIWIFYEKKSSDLPNNIPKIWFILGSRIQIPHFSLIPFFQQKIEVFHSVICILLCITNLNIFVI